MTESRSLVVWGMGKQGEGGGRRDYKEAQGNFGADEYVHYSDCGDGFRGINASQNSSNDTLSICEIFCML